MHSTEVVATLTRDDLTAMARLWDQPVVSMLLPPTPRDEARIVVRNLVSDAAIRLEAAGMRSVEARERAAAVERAVDDPEVWTPPEVSMAVYVTGESVTRTTGPSLGSPRVVVSRRAQLKHLLDSTPHPGHAVLALSLKAAHLYRATGSAFTEVEVDDLPVTMADVLRYDDPEHQLQYRIAGTHGEGRPSAAFHGHGGKDTRDEDLLRYLRAVDAAVGRELGGVPLVLAATEEVAAAFRRLTGYGMLLDAEIGGSGERHTVPEMRDAAAEIVGDAMMRHRDAVRARIADRLSTAEVAVDLRQVVMAACEGRVEAVFVAGTGGVINGYHLPEQRSVELATDGEDLINLTAIETWRQGGEVFVVPASEVPGGEPAVALLRY